MLVIQVLEYLSNLIGTSTTPYIGPLFSELLLIACMTGDASDGPLSQECVCDGLLAAEVAVRILHTAGLLPSEQQLGLLFCLKDQR
jgi:hypothetical protein